MEVAEAREKSALANPLWHDLEAKRLEFIGKKYKISDKVIDDIPKNYTTVFKRSGYNYSKRLLALTVKNNAIRLKSLNAVKDNLPMSARNQGSTKFNMTKKESRNVIFVTREAETSRKDSQKLTEGSEESLVNRMMTYKPSESALCMRTIGKILHPQIPERYLSLRYTQVKILQCCREI